MQLPHLGSTKTQRGVDLHLINETVVPLHPIVPNPYTLMFRIPGDSECFTVMDLKDAFFLISS